MFRFKSEQITPAIRRIYGFMDEQMYLIEGRDKAALIDTGTGVGDLKKYVKTYTDKDIIVILTHGHCDHAMGAAQFDCVYMNEKEMEVYEKHRQAEYRDTFFKLSSDYEKLSEDDIRQPMQFTQMNPLKDNTRFALGGLTLQVYECAGHTPGSMAVLIEEERALILGDICNPFTFLFLEESLSIQEYVQNLSIMDEKLQGKYDLVLFSHGCVKDPACDVIENVLEVCKQVCQGHDAKIPFTFVEGQKGMIANPVNEKMERLDAVLGNIVYSPEKIRYCDRIREQFRLSDEKRDKGLRTPEDVVRFDNINYGADSKWQMLDVYRPKEDENGKLPVIVNIHGGGWIYGDKDVYQYYGMNMAQRGFAIVNFSYRLAPENKFPAALEDINQVFHWMVAYQDAYGLDMDNVFVVGDSAGAQLASQYITLLTNKEYQKYFEFSVPEGVLKVRAAALNCGTYDLRQCKEQNMEILNYYFAEDIDNTAACIDVMKYVTKDFPPTVITTSYYDFLKECAEPMYQYLKSHEVPCELHQYGSKTKPEIAHVFHLNIRSEEAKLCNEMECEFFRRYEVKKHENREKTPRG